MKTMLYTNLRHIENHQEYLKAIHEHENVLIVCGRMDPSSILVYSAAEALIKEFGHISFFDIEFDNPYTQFLLTFPEILNFSEIPFIVCIKNGQILSVKGSINTKAEMSAILESEYANLYQYHKPSPAQT